jgi:hypothetical protein
MKNRIISGGATIIFGLLIPHALIGGCAMPSMACRKISFPAITVIGILLLIGMALNALYLVRKPVSA